ncbi:hypothetical protein N1851_002113 [Merluccius polli]|uniref:Uncharacterized protein n=1 Tax=Merluccius polli TaxID=89951 RepID=A0AA47NBT4_MERPO|nr:hypothetical protein N1851_002113 [Merluccius polli]
MSDADDIEDIDEVSEVTSDRDLHDLEKQLSISSAKDASTYQRVLCKMWYNSFGKSISCHNHFYKTESGLY